MCYVIVLHNIIVLLYHLRVFFVFLGSSNYVQGRILSVAGVTAAICSAPFIAFSNMIAIVLWPTWVMVAVSETIRKVCLEFLFCCFLLLLCLIVWSRITY